MSHLLTPWFAKAKEAHHKGMDSLYLYGIEYLKEHHKMFHDKEYHKTKIYEAKYIPNPFRFQYDLTMFIWLNYYKIVDQEIALYRKFHIDDKVKGWGDKAEELLVTRKLNGISRTDFLFAAGELRWPTTIMSDDSRHGLFVRDPWSERRANAWGDEYIKNIIAFGGGGQGKTLVSLAISLMIFDYFIFTQKGARCMISTVNKDKLDSVPWAYLCNLNSSTEKGISLYAGRAKIAGDHTLSRPNNKDRGGVFKGILIGNQMNKQTIVDKLTGSHGHPFVCYILDEMQSTPNPPIMAASNFTMHAKDFRIAGSGNWGENNDTLANNTKPTVGWENVNEETGQWISTMENGQKAIVMHFNNNLSPGMEEQGNRMYPHLPSRKNLNDKYPDAAKRNNKNISYRRFWVGYRVVENGDTTVINESLVKENLAHLPLDFTKILHSFFTFDSAQAEVDRNLAVVYREGIDRGTNQRVFGPDIICPLDKATESLKYYHESSMQLLQIAKKNNIVSGAGVVDWTGRPAQAEILQQHGFEVKKLIYNKGVPDGIRRDKHTKRVEREIKININLDFKDDIPPEKLCAHHVAENMISLGAWALREYIKAGRVRGLNENIVKFMNGERTIEEELFTREFYYKNSATYGSRFQLEPKVDFKDKYGFSPDLLDNLFEAAWYMLLYRNLPLTPIGNDGMLLKEEKDFTSDHEDHSEMWESDLIL